MSLILHVILSSIICLSVARSSPQWQQLDVFPELVEPLEPILETNVYVREESATNTSNSVVNSNPTDNDAGLTWDNAVGKGKNVITLLGTDDLSQCGIAQSSFTKWEALAQNGWGKRDQGASRDDSENATDWRPAAGKFGLSTDDQKNIQYDLGQLTDVTIGGTSYRNSGGWYTNVMNTDGVIFALQSFSPHTRGASKSPSLDGSPGHELVPLQTWADVTLLEWVDACKGDEKCVKGLKLVTKCHAKSNATMQIANQALGGTEKWGLWPGKTFSKDSEQFAALMATPSGRGVAWLLLTHREQLGWKYVKSVNLWSETDHDSKSNYYTFNLEDGRDGGVSRTRLARSTVSAELSSQRIVDHHSRRATQSNESSIVYDGGSGVDYGKLFASDHDYTYDEAQKIGGYLANLTQSSAEQSCVQQSEWKFSDLESNGWSSTTSNLDNKAALDTLRTIFSDNKLSLDDETPEHTVWEHIKATDTNGTTHPVTHAKYDALYSKHAIVILGSSSPASESSKGGKELLPPLKALSDVLWLQWADWSKAKNFDSKDLRFVVVYPAANNYTARIIEEILGNQAPPEYPGKSFGAESKELHALLASPHGQGVVWLLSQRKSELGIKIVKSVQIWNEQQPCILFEISDLETNGTQNAVTKKSSAGSRAVRKSLSSRALTWEEAVAKGKGYLNMLKCGSGRPSEFTSIDDLTKWGWKLDFNNHPTYEPVEAHVKAAEYLGVTYSAQEVYQIVDAHAIEVKVGGITYPPTTGSYSNTYAEKFIIAEANWSPRYEVADQMLPITVFPELEKLSDVMFLDFKRTMERLNKPLTGLKGLLRSHVINDETERIVGMALGVRLTSLNPIPEWPGTDFAAESDEAAAICASPNGRGAVWLLGTHKEQLGHKTISKVRVYRQAQRLYILFVFEDVNGDSSDDEDGGVSLDDHGKRSAPVSHTVQLQKRVDPATDDTWAKNTERGTTLLGMLNCGNGPEGKWKNYDDLKTWGWRKPTEKPSGEAYQDEVNAMNYLQLSPLPTLTEIEFTHKAATNIEGVDYPPTWDWYKSHYDSEFIAAISNFGPGSDGEPKGPLPELRHLSDIWFLGFSQLMSTQKKPLNKLKGILRYQVVTPETKELLLKALKTDLSGVRKNPPKWPGTDFQAGSDEFAALLGSPHGRGVAWLLINHKELGRKTIDRVRVWYEPRDRMWMMLFVFKDVTDESGDQSQPPSSDLAQADSDQQSKQSGVAVRALGLPPEKYQQLLDNGKKLISSLNSGEDCVAQSEFTDYRALAEWGWTVKTDEERAPPKTPATTSVFDFVGASWDISVNREVLDLHDETTEKDGKTYYKSGGSYKNHYNPSVIIAKANFGPAFGGKQQNPRVTGGANYPFPQLARLSDFLFLEYQRVMTENNQPMNKLKGVWRDLIVNQVTKAVAIQVASNDGGPLGIPKWPGVDFAADSDALAALTASPNGVGVAYLLLQHREKLGHKTISSVRVWYDFGVHVLFLIDDVGAQAGSSSSNQRRNQLESSAASSNPGLEAVANYLQPRALDDAVYAKFTEKGKALVSALQSSSMCMAQSEWTTDESLSTWGWYRSRKPNVGPVSLFATTKAVYEFVGASTDNNMNHRAIDMHDTNKEIDGTTYYKTGAEFDNRYNPAMIVAENIYGAEYQGKTKNPPVTGNPNPFPKLKLWSDVTFLEFQKFMKDSGQGVNPLKAVWHRTIINPDTRGLAAKISKVDDWTKVPDWPGKDFKPGTDEFAALVGSDNGRGVAYMLLQHREQLGVRSITNARVWMDSVLHVLYTIDDSGATGGSDAAKNPSLVRRQGDPDSEQVDEARTSGRLLVMAQDSDIKTLEECLNMPQSKFTETRQLAESGWTLLSDRAEAVDEDWDSATFNSFADIGNLDLTADANHEIKYQHLEKTTGSDGTVYYPSGAYYYNFFNEGGIAAMDNASPWKAGHGMDPPVDGTTRPFPPLKQWSDAVFLTYKGMCQGDPARMKRLKGCLRHNVVNTRAKQVLSEYMGKHGELSNGKVKTWPGTVYNLNEDGFFVAMGVPNGKGVAFLLATHRESLGWKEIYKIRIFSVDWVSSYNILYYVRDHQNAAIRRDVTDADSAISTNTTTVRDLALRVSEDDDSIDRNDAVGAVIPRDKEVSRHRRQADSDEEDHSDLYKSCLERGALLYCKLDDSIDSVPQSEWVNYESLGYYGWVAKEPRQYRLDPGLSAALQALNLPVDAPSYLRHRYDQELASKHDGVDYPASGAEYNNAFNVEGGVIIADVNKGPDYMQGRTRANVVPLKQYSDVLFLAWQKAAGDKTKGLKYVFRNGIVNDDTIEVMQEILGKRGVRDTAWPGLRLEMGDDEESWALLGTPNGRGVAWMLIQHKEQLGLKTISAVTIFRNQSGMSLCFWIADVDPDVVEMDDAPDLQNRGISSAPEPMGEQVERSVDVSTSSETVAPALRAGERLMRAFSKRVGEATKNFWAALTMF